MPRFFDWYITEHQDDEMTEWERRESLGKGRFFYIGHGNVTDSPKFEDGDRIRTSVVKRLEFIKEDELLRVHTQNSIYDCAMRDCDFRQQEPLAVLPFPLEHYAKKYKFGDWGEPERDSILLVFADDKEYCFVDAWVNLKGNIYRLDYDVHLGTFQDSCLLNLWDSTLPEAERLGKIDIRFFPPANFISNQIEFYQFSSAGFPVYLHNAGKRVLRFGTEDGFIEVKPKERKRVSTENAAQE